MQTIQNSLIHPPTPPNTHLRGYTSKARVWQRGCMLTPLYYRGWLEIRFLSLHTEWGSLLSYSPRFVKNPRFVCILKSSSVWRRSRHTPTPSQHTHPHTQWPPYKPLTPTDPPTNTNSTKTLASPPTQNSYLENKRFFFLKNSVLTLSMPLNI